MQRREFLTLLLGSAATGCLASSSWRTADSLPLAIQEIYPILHDNLLVVAGGLSRSNAGELLMSDKVFGYPHSATQVNPVEWIELPRLPQPSHHVMLQSLNQRLFALSGFSANNGGQWSASTRVLELRGSVWTSLVSMPFPLCETVSAVHQGRIHLATGRRPKSLKNSQWKDHNDVADHLIFDVAKNEWSVGTAAPTARNSAAAALINHHWHIVGGRTVAGGNLATHEVYDFDSKKWDVRAPLPDAQGGLAAAAIKDKLYVFGGEYFTKGGGVYSAVWCYDTRTDRWKKVSEMPVPRHGLGAVAIEDEIYIVAGAAEAGANQTSKRLSIFKP